MEETLITTIDNRIVDKSLCRKMGQHYYLKGDVNIENSGECYYIDDKYYKYNTGYIFFDHTVKQYVKKGSVEHNIVEGIVDVKEDGTLSYGYFSINLKKKDYVQLHNNIGTFVCLNENMIKACKYYKENLQDGDYYLRKNLDSCKFVKPSVCDRNYKQSLPYDSRNIISNIKESYLDNYIPDYHYVLKDLKSDLTKGLTFGVEYETIVGMLPNRFVNKLGLIPLRDGSIDGLEYVTVPLKGHIGLQTILDINKELKKRTSYDNSCSLHLHIGNIPRTEEFFLALFKVLFLVQDEVYSMFPHYKKENYDIKRKHYTKPLPLKETMLLFDSNIKTKEDVKKNFSILYQFLSTNQSYDKAGGSLDRIKNHPSDPGGDSKWNIKSRYYWVNLIPLLFGNKQTVEFRVHTSTYDSNKIMNYMLMCFAIVNYTIKNQDSILKNFCNYINIDLNQIVFDEYYNDFNHLRLVEDLQKYFQCRRQHFFNKTKKGDFIAEENDFIYEHPLINWNNNIEICYKFTNKTIAPKVSTMGGRINHIIPNDLNGRIQEILREVPNNFGEFRNEIPMPNINDVPVFRDDLLEEERLFEQPNNMEEINIIDDFDNNNELI